MGLLPGVPEQLTRPQRKDAEGRQGPCRGRTDGAMQMFAHASFGVPSVPVVWYRCFGNFLGGGFLRGPALCLGREGVHPTLTQWVFYSPSSPQAGQSATDPPAV